MSTGTLEQPPQPNPALKTAKARKTLIDLHLDVALQRCRGYSVDILYGDQKAARFAANRISLRLNRDGVVEEVV